VSAERGSEAAGVERGNGTVPRGIALKPCRNVFKGGETKGKEELEIASRGPSTNLCQGGGAD